MTYCPQIDGDCAAGNDAGKCPKTDCPAPENKQCAFTEYCDSFSQSGPAACPTEDCRLAIIFEEYELEALNAKEHYRTVS